MKFYSFDAPAPNEMFLHIIFTPPKERMRKEVQDKYVGS